MKTCNLFLTLSTIQLSTRSCICERAETKNKKRCPCRFKRMRKQHQSYQMDINTSCSYMIDMNFPQSVKASREPNCTANAFEQHTAPRKSNNEVYIQGTNMSFLISIFCGSTPSPCRNGYLLLMRTSF